jgi:dTDP-4-amino-4,6-dideoxygalactose transaminase
MKRRGFSVAATIGGPMSFSVPYTDLANETAALIEPLREAFERVVLSGRYLLGPELAAFEAQLAAVCGARHALGTSSGTAALEMTLRALDLPPGAEVVTVPNSFVATAAAIALAGANPVFADIGEDGNMDPASLEAALTPRTRVVLPVHLAGRPAKMREILRIAEKRGLVVVEDAAQSVGAKLDGQPVGSFGHAACFSLNPLKNLYAYGDGGAVTTSDPALAKKLAQARSHGLADRERCDFFSQNCRLDELQAALVRVQLSRLPAKTEARRALAQRYNELLAPYGEVPLEGPGEHCVYQTYVFKCERRDALQEHLRANGVEAIVHYRTLIPEQPAARGLGEVRATPRARRHADRILSLPLYPGLTRAQQDRVVSLVGGFLGRRAA